MAIWPSVISLCLICFSSALIQPLPERNTTVFATAFVEICRAIETKSIVVFITNSTRTRKVNEFMLKCHEISLQIYLFKDIEAYYRHVTAHIEVSLETTSLIFAEPWEIIPEIQRRRLDHRLSLFLFYWGEKDIRVAKKMGLELREPLRVAYITHPRKKVYHIHYNMATPDGSGNLKLVNWYDANSLGLFREPLLPLREQVYKTLGGRMLYIPVIHVRGIKSLKTNQYF